MATQSDHLTTIREHGTPDQAEHAAQLAAYGRWAELRALAAQVRPEPVTVEIFVAADNTTHRVDRDAVMAILDARHAGWTLSDAIGSWQGQREESVRIIVSADRADVHKTLVELRDTLHQEAVAYREISALRFV